MIFTILVLAINVYFMSVCALELLMGVEGCFQAYKDKLHSKGICIDNPLIIIASFPICPILFCL